MIEKEENILRKYLSNDQMIVLMQNDILHLVAMAMRAYKNEDKLVKNLALSGVSHRRELLLAFDKHCYKQLGIKEQEGDKMMIEDFLANNCG
jgi:hypothetical protein